MAIKRKKRYENPAKCSFCKEVRAYHTVHGYHPYGGNTCCNVCFPELIADYERERERERNYEMTEADYQTWGRL